MRWTRGAQPGDTRIREFFAWLPVTVGYPSRETRWLETIRVEEEFVKGRNGYFWRMDLQFLERE